MSEKKEEEWNRYEREKYYAEKVAEEVRMKEADMEVRSQRL